MKLHFHSLISYKQILYISRILFKLTFKLAQKTNIIAARRNKSSGWYSVRPFSNIVQKWILFPSQSSIFVFITVVVFFNAEKEVFIKKLVTFMFTLTFGVFGLLRFVSIFQIRNLLEVTNNQSRLGSKWLNHKDMKGTHTNSLHNIIHNNNISNSSVWFKRHAMADGVSRTCNDCKYDWRSLCFFVFLQYPNWNLLFTKMYPPIQFSSSCLRL